MNLDTTVKETAVEWLSRRDLGMTEEEARAFEIWKENPRHAAALTELEFAWNAANRPRKAGTGAALRVRVEAVLAGKRARRRRIAIGSFAAAAAVVFGALVFLPNRETAVPRTIALRPDQQVLPDGSRVQLNAGAEIKMAFDEHFRRVRLVRGEALFEVAKDATHPFIVEAGAVAVRAVGTAFTVRRMKDEVGVLVTEGKVAVGRVEEAASDQSSPARAIEPVYLTAGAELRVPVVEDFATAPVPRAATTEEIAAALAWRNQRVEFSGTTLDEAVGYFNRGNRIQLEIVGDEIGRMRISGVFWTDDPEAFSRNLETSLGISALQAGDRIVLRK